MTFNIKKSRGFKMLKPSDKDFTFSPNGVTIVPRASFEISSNCPREYREIILQAYQNGWISPVANMRDTEYLVEILR